MNWLESATIAAQVHGFLLLVVNMVVVANLKASESLHLNCRLTAFCCCS